MKRSARTRSTQRPTGQALVEFALVFPLVILVLLSVFDVGRGVFIYNGLTNAAREGARLAIVNQDPALVEQRVQEQTFASTISNVGNVVHFYKEGPNDDPTTNPQCTATTMATGCIAVVTAEVDWSAITPIVGAIIGPIKLTARSTLPVELVCPNPKYPDYATSAMCPKQP